MSVFTQDGTSDLKVAVSVWAEIMFILFFFAHISDHSLLLSTGDGQLLSVLGSEEPDTRPPAADQRQDQDRTCGTGETVHITCSAITVKSRR